MLVVMGVSQILIFSECAVVISYDRWFLDRVATYILAFEGEHGVIWYDGNYTQYEQYRKKELGLDSLHPQRVKYKKLMR